MFEPSLREIVRIRYFATLVVRLIGIIFLVVGAMFILLWIVEGVKDDDILMFGYYGMRVATGASLAAVGAVFFFLGRRVVRRLTPISDASCPRCDYALRALRSSCCPECGLAFLEQAPSVETEREEVANPPTTAPRAR